MEKLTIDKKNEVNISEPANLENSMASIVVDVVPYMETLGYGVSQETSALLFRTLSQLDSSSFRSFLDVEPIFESLIASSPKEHTSFSEDFRNFLENRTRIVADEETANEIRNVNRNNKYVMQKKTRIETEIEETKRRIRSLEKRAEKEDQSPVGERSVKTYEKKYEQVRKEYESMFRKSASADILLNLEDYASGRKEASEEEIERARKDLKAGAKKALGKKNAKELLALIEKQNSMLNAVKKSFRKGAKAELKKETGMLERLKQERAEAEKEAERVAEEIRRKMTEIRKEAVSGNHRQTFERARNAVSSDYEGEPSMDRAFASLSQKEKERIRDYVRDNARKFKTRISRNVRTGIRRRIDVPQTCKSACRTAGVPIELAFMKPHRQKSRLVMFLDVSGSCKNASEMMLTFMHEMKDVFTGGCRTYAFTNRLYDVSEAFEESEDSDTFVKAVLTSIPRSGAYSDYRTPLKDFYENRMSELTKDSIVLFIGDARNNKNKTGERYLKAIARRAKKTYWLNTEPIHKWDSGDSIMSVYAPYMVKTTQVTTPGELLNFLQEMR